jgi:DNA modification methylase
MVNREGIQRAEQQLAERFRERPTVNPDLSRMLVSFQANRQEFGYRWYKYKEGFSADLVRYLFHQMGIQRGPVLDPFAGSGTTLFVSWESGLDSTGIELLPLGAEIIRVRRDLLQGNRQVFAKALRTFAQRKSWEQPGKVKQLVHFSITEGAYPADTQRQLERYLWDIEQAGDEVLFRLLRFAALCVLETISYTRKDGQYLRWDIRSGRRRGTKPFDKGPIPTFTEAITAKLREMADDLTPPNNLFEEGMQGSGNVELLEGSCLEKLPELKTGNFCALITSPPYCNRYDYTRTYALELALLGVDEIALKRLRQAMLSCTVENKEKTGLDKIYGRSVYERAKQVFEAQEVLQLVLAYLESRRRHHLINNAGITWMVRNYFLESALWIAECARLLQPGAPFIMVNDNVRYEGVHIPVDLILADFAEKLGFSVEHIWVLPCAKGNSSQQMGRHGRYELRKCVYVWRKIKDLEARKPDGLFAPA